MKTVQSGVLFEMLVSSVRNEILWKVKTRVLKVLIEWYKLADQCTLWFTGWFHPCWSNFTFGVCQKLPSSEERQCFYCCFHPKRSWLVCFHLASSLIVGASQEFGSPLIIGTLFDIMFNQNLTLSNIKVLHVYWWIMSFLTSKQAESVCHYPIIPNCLSEILAELIFWIVHES